MLRTVAAVVGALALLCVTFAPQQLFVPVVPMQQPLVRAPAEYQMHAPVQVGPSVHGKSSFDAAMLGWGLVGFAGAVAMLSMSGTEQAAKARWLANQGSGYSPHATGAQGFAGRVVPMATNVAPAAATGAVRQTVADVGGAEFVPNAAGTEWVRNDFGSRAVNPSTGLGGSSGAPSPYRGGAARYPSPTGAIRQTVADVNGPEYVPNAAGSEYIRNDFGGRPVNPSTGLNF